MNVDALARLVYADLARSGVVIREIPLPIPPVCSVDDGVPLARGAADLSLPTPAPAKGAGAGSFSEGVPV